MTASLPAEDGDRIVRVYKYGILPQVPRDKQGKPTGRRRDLPLEVVAEIERAVRLRNKLVALELEHQARVQEIWLSSPEISRKTELAARLAEDDRQLYYESSSTAIIDRAPNFTAALAITRRRLKDAKASLREAKTSRGYLLLKGQFEEAKADYYAAVKALYAPAVRGGLYWASYNAVVARHKTAVEAVSTRRKAGRPAQLRETRFDGTGTISAQLQPSTAHGRTPQALAAGEYATVLQLSPWIDPGAWKAMTLAERKKRWTGTLRFRIGSEAFRPGLSSSKIDWQLVERSLPEDARWLLSLLALDADTGRDKTGGSYRGCNRKALLAMSGLDPKAFAQALAALERQGLAWQAQHAVFLTGASYAEVVTLPVRVHRMMPADAEIVAAQITRSRIGDDYHASVSLTARVPRPQMKSEGQLAAVHLGWRQLSDGALRVAVVRGIPAPGNPWVARLGVVRSHEGWHEVVIPPSWRDVLANTTKIQGQRNRNLDDLAVWLSAWLEENGRYTELLCEPGELKRRGTHFYRNLLTGLEAEDGLGTLPAALKPVQEYLSAWQAQDRHLGAWSAHERNQIIARRDYAYQLVAKWVCSAAAQVVIDGWDMSTMARREKNDPNQLPPAARANRVIASPGRLREYISRGGVTHGARVTRAGRLPPLQHSCGTRLEGSALMLLCSECQVVVDQDVAALGMLESFAQAS